MSVAADPCPRCDAPLGEDDSCRECGYDAELAGRNYRGDDADLGDDEAEEYEAFLAREGLGEDAGGSRLALIVGILALLGRVLALAVGSSQ